MRHATITFVATLLGVLFALVAFEFYRNWDEQRAQKNRATVVLQVDEQGRELDAEVAAELRAIELIRDDVVAVSAAKTSVSESFMNMGKVPTSNAEAGLLPAESYRGRSLRSAEVIAEGRIRLTFDGESGHEGGIIELIPDVDNSNSMGVQWRCETRDYPQIVRALPSCDYVATASTK